VECNNKLIEKILNQDLKKLNKDLNREREIEYNILDEDFNQEKWIKLDIERGIKSRKELTEKYSKFTDTDFMKHYNGNYRKK